jgi:hypothetical protein
MRFLFSTIILLATYAYCSAAAQDDAASIYFFRAKCPPVAVKGTLSIDGVKYSVVPVRRYAVVRITPGKHELKFAFPLWAGTPSKKLTIEAVSNSVRYFYYTTDMDFMIGAPAPTTTITPELIEISEENAKRLMGEFERIP